MNKKRWLIIGAVIVLLIILGLTTETWHIVYVDGPYHGRVIDKTTGRPIVGAAVVAVWSKEVPFIAHAIITYYDAQETLTDQQGNFTIPGVWGVFLIPLTKMRDPLFTIFKPGYEAYRARKLGPSGGKGRTDVRLQLLTVRKERLENLGRIYVSSHVPEEKYSNLIRLRNIERKQLGLRPTHVRKEDP